jgi:hypothetical protein
MKRSNVTGRSMVCAGPPTRPRSAPGGIHDQRHADLLFVEGTAVIVHLMLAEGFSMICGERDDRVGVVLPNMADQTPELRVDVGNFTMVAVDCSRTEINPRMALVGMMRLEHVDPNEELPAPYSRRKSSVWSTRLAASRCSYFTYSKSK